MNTDTYKELCAWANSVRGTAFVWGETDCVMLAASALDVILGRDVSGRWRGQWDSEESAMAYDDMPSVALAALGLVAVTPAESGNGDILIAPHGRFPETCHVVFGRYALTSDPVHGVGYVRTADLRRIATAALRVP